MTLLRGLRQARDRLLGALIKPLTQIGGPPLPPWIVSADTIVFVLDGNSLVDSLLLRQRCRELGLGAKTRQIQILRRGQRQWLRRLARLETTATLVPAAVYIGRTPGRQASLLKILFAESWAVSRYLRKLFALLFNGRDTLVVFGQPCSVQADEQALAAALGTQLDSMRSAIIGPDFSHRSSLVRQLLGRFAIRRAIVADAREQGSKPRRAQRRAGRILVAMVADCTQITLRVLHRLLGWFWNRFYDGIEARGIERVKALALHSRIVYVPCHRSHIDYLVLSYLLYENQLAVPYIAAGDNLNVPLIGRILRGGGAFFIRRSFRGDALYATLVAEYIHEMLRRGATLEYFIEGGRSRTGRQLPSRPGMLAMTLHSFLRDHQRPLAFVPVHFSYEKLIEAPTYLNELRGQGKRRESVVGLLRAVAGLRGRFGRVVASFGEPIDLAAYLDRQQAGWREQRLTPNVRPVWLDQVVDQLGERLAAAINAQAYLTPVHCVALALLATPRQVDATGALLRQMEVLKALPTHLPACAGIGVSPLDAAAMLRQTESLDLIRRRRDALGELVYADGARSVLLTYYRNSALHVFVLPALIAAAFQQSRVLHVVQLRRSVNLVYPLLVEELSIALADRDLNAMADQAINALIEVGLLQRRGEQIERPPASDPAASRLNLLAGLVQHSLERYFLVVAVLLRQGSVAIDREHLVERCRAVAQRMSVLYGLDAPEFFDRSLFSRFVDQLQQRGLVRGDADGGLLLEPKAMEFDADARLLLSDRIRYGVLNLLDAPSAEME